MRQLKLNLDIRVDAYYDYSATLTLFGARQQLGFPVRYRAKLDEQDEGKELSYHDAKLLGYLQQGEILSSCLVEVTKDYIDNTQEIPGHRMPYCHEDTHM